ncbi:hypothetical protein L4D20_02500 [Vibrio kyushuensis]|uniref:hypothetical protein n=1 Tax=Vibrio kyushuensis TaxID=2910249 RepID=UPI003D0B33DD
MDLAFKPRNPIKLFFMITMVLLISGCKIESQQDLTAGMRSFKPSFFFKENTSVYQLDGGTKYLNVLNLSNTMLQVVYSDFADGDNDEVLNIMKVVRHERMPSGYFIAVEEASGNAYRYHPFLYHSQSQISVVTPPDSIEVSSPSELLASITEVINTGKKAQYSVIDGPQKRYAMARFKALSRSEVRFAYSSNLTNTLTKDSTRALSEMNNEATFTALLSALVIKHGEIQDVGKTCDQECEYDKYYEVVTSIESGLFVCEDTKFEYEKDAKRLNAIAMTDKYGNLQTLTDPQFMNNGWDFGEVLGVMNAWNTSAQSSTINNPAVTTILQKKLSKSGTSSLTCEQSFNSMSYFHDALYVADFEKGTPVKEMRNDIREEAPWNCNLVKELHICLSDFFVDVMVVNAAVNGLDQATESKYNPYHHIDFRPVVDP